MLKFGNNKDERQTKQGAHFAKRPISLHSYDLPDYRNAGMWL